MEKRRPGEEIRRDEYDRLRTPDAVPLSSCGAKAALHNLNLPIWDGYMLPKEGGQLFDAYGWNHYEKEKKYFYLGEVLDDPKLNGIYYFFDCLNAFANDGYFPAEDFKDEADAIQTGADYEADIYKLTFIDGVETARELLYTPYEGIINGPARRF